METLFYILLLLFYLISGYRERKKKAIAKKSIPNLDKKDITPEPELPQSETKNMLDFLNDAFEKMENQAQTVDEDNIASSQVFFDQVNSESIKHSSHDIEPNFDEHFDSDHDISKVDERHLEELSTKIKHHKTKYDISFRKNNIKSIQKKYQNNPFQLAIVMQEILNKPKGI